MQTVKLTAVVSVLMMVFGLESMAAPRMVVWDADDKAGIHRLEVDTVAVIEVESNPSTGYAWQVGLKHHRLKVLGVELVPSDSGLLGAPGVERIYLVGAGRGEDLVTLSYRRPHEAQILSSKRIRVRSQGSFRGRFQVPQPELTLPEPYVSTNKNLPSHFNWCEVGGCTPVKNQGSCGSCWSFGTVGPLESAILVNDGQTVDLAEQYLVSCNSEGWGCNGGWFAHDYHQWKTAGGETEAGSVLEANKPYQAADTSCGGPYPKSHQIEGWEYVGSSGSVPPVDDLKQAIYDHGPLAVAVCSNNDMQVYSGGVFTGASCSGVNHAVILTGWDDDDGAWIMRNSWGTGWGENGYMRIKYGVSQIGYGANYVIYGGSDIQARFAVSGSDHTIQFADQSTPSSGAALNGWQWDFGDGATSSAQNPIHTYSSSGDFTVTLTVSDTAGQSDTTSQTVTAPFVPQYCSSAGQDASSEWLAQVEIGGFSNDSAGQGYSDFTGLTVALEPGVAAAVTLTPGFNGGPWTEVHHIWIDLDRNGQFEDQELLFSQSGQAAVSGSLTVPASAPQGTTRMRITMKYQAAPTPCESFSYGEVEDYTVEIGGGGNLPPTAAFAFETEELGVTFQDQSGDADGSINSWHWDFGDGATSSQQHPAHTYAAAGSYDVTLTVADDGGLSDSVTRTVQVSVTPGDNELINGVPVSGLSGAKDEWLHFWIQVPEGGLTLTMQISGGSGDADLYTRFGDQPTLSVYDCRPYRSGNNETCTVGATQAGTYYLGIHGYSAFSNLTVEATYEDSGMATLDNGDSVSGLSGSQGEWLFYRIWIPAGASNLDVRISGGSGDADLYTRYGQLPTSSEYDCRPYRNGNNETCTSSAPGEGYTYIGIRAYSDYSGVTLSVDHD